VTDKQFRTLLKFTKTRAKMKRIVIEFRYFLFSYLCRLIDRGIVRTWERKEESGFVGVCYTMRSFLRKYVS